MTFFPWPLMATDAIRLGFVASTGAGGALVGLVLQRRDTLGGYSRPGDPAPPRRHAEALPLVAAAVWSLLTARLPLPDDAHGAVVLSVHLVLSTLVLVACMVDTAVRRLPDALTLPLAVLTVLAATVGLLLGDPGTVVASGRTLIAAALVPAAALSLTLTIGGLGLCDVKLICSLAGVLAWHGWGTLLTAALLSWSSAGVFALALLLQGRADRSTAIPLGPFLGGGTLAALLL